MKQIMDSINKQAILQAKISRDIYQATRENQEWEEEKIRMKNHIPSYDTERHLERCEQSGIDLCVCFAKSEALQGTTEAVIL